MKQLVILLLSSAALCSYAANPANDNANRYKDPWGPGHAQNRAASGFAKWIFQPGDSSPNPAYQIRHNAALNTNVFAIPMSPYTGLFVSFTGDGQLDSGQTYTTTLVFHAPGHSTTEGPTQGIQLIAQSPTVPPNPNYGKFGHQVLGLYLGQINAKKYGFFLGIHNTLSDENADKWVTLPINFVSGITIKLEYIVGSAGAWQLKLFPSTAISGAGSGTGNAVVLTSSEYGTTWNTTTGVDGIQIFNSQSEETGHPFCWTSMSVK